MLMGQINEMLMVANKWNINGANKWNVNGGK